MRQPMIYIATFALVLLSACSFIANANNDPSKAEDNRPLTYKIDMATDISEYKEYHMTIHYPQTPNNQIDQTIIDYTNQKKAAFKQKSYQALQNQENNQSYELHVDFEILYQDRHFFVVRFIETMDVGMSEPLVEQTIMNFEKEEGNRLEPQELFKEEEYDLEKLVENREEAPSVDEVNVAWTADGLALYLKQLKSGQELIELNQDKVKDMLKASYVELMQANRSIEPEGIKSEENTASSSAGQATSMPLKKDSGKRVALTFDDGPHPKVTKNILNILDEHEVQASFFMIGKRVSYYPDVAQDVATAGHEIGNHTWNHPRLTRLTSEQIDEQIEMTQSEIQQAVGFTPSLIRLPFGERTTHGYRLQPVGWNVTFEHGRSKSAAEIAAEIVAKVEDESVILLNDIHPSMVEVVDLVVKELSDQGYEFVPVSHIQQ
ncbi:polysaccharide deacetylase family protein [Halobacillus locisalis]|uniref:Polysaccharide deacetylase family protein n=1 Tax=Halobacillus locisalis TaxID=220753 RepID=A0A838CT56_9BACI|nr:polysaccharide deacetylase family protein [Halobacillus locisalis]MBA2175124.1 polysaccharide deacetylase family protein [Halobacillus locisalis]